MSEHERIKQIYSNYSNDPCWKAKYSIFNYEVLYASQEFDRKMLECFKKTAFSDRLSDCRIIDIGGGYGSNCLKMMLYGVKPENITFNEIYEPRFRDAVDRLPASCKTMLYDATEIDSRYDGKYDLVCIHTVFSSILDDEIRKKLANRIWKLLDHDGAIIFYDFKYNNPNNPNVRKVTLKELHSLFPNSIITFRKVTIAPPISRRIIKIPVLGRYLLPLFNIGIFKTHILAIIKKR